MIKCGVKRVYAESVNGIGILIEFGMDGVVFYLMPGVILNTFKCVAGVKSNFNI